jgi:hypothetical protein
MLCDELGGYFSLVLYIWPGLFYYLRFGLNQYFKHLKYFFKLKNYNWMVGLSALFSLNIQLDYKVR